MKTASKTITAFIFLNLLCVSAFSAPPGPIGTVAMVNGTVTITSGTKTASAKPGTPVHAGDRIVAANPGKAKIIFLDDTIINIGHNTDLVVTKAMFSLDRRDSLFNVSKGRFKVAVGKIFTGTSDFKLATPTAVAGVRGTVFWGDTDLDAICALSGEVEVTPVSNSSAGRALANGQCAAEFKSGKTTPIAPTAEAVKGYIDEVTPQ